MTAAINAMRTADGDLAKLLALRAGAQAIAPYADVEALGHLSDYAIDVLDLGTDAVQGAIAEGMRLSEAGPREGQRNGNGHAAKAPEPKTPPFAYVDLATDPIPARAWAVAPDRIPAGAVTLFSGHGAIGKSLLVLQLCAATVLGRDWVTMLPEHGPALYFSAEEDGDEICRRLERIAAHYGTTRTELRDAGLWAVSRAGADAILAAPDRNGLVKPTPMFEQLRTDATNVRPKLIVIDTAADVFAGNEIDRSQTRQFITLLRGLAMQTGAALILLSHPSLTGLKSASGLSGSTAWHNSVRARMYLAAVKAKDDEDDDDDSGAELRKLEFLKNNYGPSGAAVVLRWRDGVFAPEPVAGSIDAMAAAFKADEMFLTLLRRFDAEGRTVSHKGSANHAPSVFAKEDAAKAEGIKSKALAAAMSRLFVAGRLRVTTTGSKSRLRSHLMEVEK
jgi:RecA-family ATPase